MKNGQVNCTKEDPKKLGGKGAKMQRKGLTPAQKKLPPALQAAILKKQNG
jgi:hypothetical protein